MRRRHCCYHEYLGRAVLCVPYSVPVLIGSTSHLAQLRTKDEAPRATIQFISPIPTSSCMQRGSRRDPFQLMYDDMHQARARGYRTTRLRSSALSEVPSWRNGQTNRQTDASRRSQVRRLICRAGITCRLMIDQIRPSVDPWRPRPSSGLRHARSKQNCQPGVVWRTAASCATSATRCRTTDRLSKHEVYAKECRQRSVIEPIKPCIVCTTVITPTTACTTQASGMSVLIFPPHA